MEISSPLFFGTSASGRCVSRCTSISCRIHGERNNSRPSMQDQKGGCVHSCRLSCVSEWHSCHSTAQSASTVWLAISTRSPLPRRERETQAGELQVLLPQCQGGDRRHIQDESSSPIPLKGDKDIQSLMCPEDKGKQIMINTTINVLSITEG